MWSVVNEQIISRGPLSFSEFQNIALYHPQAGFYSTRGSAGRNRDFLTSPEVGLLFAQVMAEAIDKWWRHLGRPNPFFIFEAGAGTGTLAANILSCELRCSAALRYITVERSASLRGEQTGKLALQASEIVLDPKPLLNKRGPLVTTMAQFPEGKFTGIVLANELLDNLGVDLYERRGRHWFRVCVGISNEGGFEEVFEPIDTEADEAELNRVRHLAPNAPDGARFPMQREATNWLEHSLGLLSQGKVVAIDYMKPTKWMLSHNFDDWCRTYRNQRAGTSPLDSPGTQDITCEVAVDQLAEVRPIDRDRSQAEFLDDFGLSELVSEAREVWHTRAAIGDLGALKARSKVQEGRALTDTQGLGNYRVLEWDVS